METITIEVEPEIARAYQNSSSTERPKYRTKIQFCSKLS
jgi:hypothetical protein